MSEPQNNGTQDYRDAHQALAAMGLPAATREEWIERTGQDPLDPSTWNKTIVDVVREQRRNNR